MVPKQNSIIKFIKCNWKTRTDAACRERYSNQKNGFFCIMVCGQCQGEECSNKSKSSIIDDIYEASDRNVFDAFASF